MLKLSILMANKVHRCFWPLGFLVNVKIRECMGPHCCEIMLFIQCFFVTFLYVFNVFKILISTFVHLWYAMYSCWHSCCFATSKRRQTWRWRGPTRGLSAQDTWSTLAHLRLRWARPPTSRNSADSRRNWKKQSLWKKTVRNVCCNQII